MKIYTKTGDHGETSLFDGARVSKDNPRIDLYGEVDELNSVIGLAASFISDQDLKDKLYHIQRDLFALGAHLANPSHKKQKEKSDFDKNKYQWLEDQIDQIDQKLAAMTSFILPGGTSGASSLHMARCICRRVERKTVQFNKTTEIDEIYLIYLNRLSDYLFCAARLANHLEKVDDVPWS